MFAGTAIHNMIDRHDGKTVGHVDGVAASIASVILMACDEIVIPANAYVMIHRPMCNAFGSIDDLMKSCEVLETIEEGIIKFIGSTTENPYFSVNNAILSRVRNIYEFKRLSPNDIMVLLKRTLEDTDKGFGALQISYDENALRTLAEMSGGDCRVALDTLGFIVDNLSEGSTLDSEIVAEAMQRQTTFYDKEEDKYNLLSALQKSVRGSDPDAAVHYLARLLHGGADVVMIGRRLLVMASEDVGMAYPSAISVVTACVQAAQMVGLPEAQFPLADAVLLVCNAPKSNSGHNAILAAREDVRAGKAGPIPRQLQNKHFDGADNPVKGQFYKYPHDYPNHWVVQQYLPENLQGTHYYEYGENKTEQAYRAYWERIKNSGNL